MILHSLKTNKFNKNIPHQKEDFLLNFLIISNDEFLTNQQWWNPTEKHASLKSTVLDVTVETRVMVTILIRSDLALQQHLYDGLNKIQSIIFLFNELL